MHPLPGRVLLPEETIQARVREMAAEIADHYRDRHPLVLGVMNGALFFLVDLLRSLEIETEVCCLRLASYEGRASTGRLEGLEALGGSSVAGRPVLIVDDIFDTGHTLTKIITRLAELGAAEVKTCILLEKDRPREMPLRVDWIGFRIPDAFVIGYGLDHDGRYRGLRDIRALD